MALFHDVTPEVIQQRILGRIGSELQTREGSYTYDLVAPVAFELWRVMMTLDELVTAFYVDEASGVYLDKHGALLGLTRRQGSKARAAVALTGTPGAVIPAGTPFYTHSGLEYRLLEDAPLDGTGAAAGTVEAAETGDVYNVEAGGISQTLSAVAGLDGFAAGQAAGGTDPETDEALFRRIDSRRKHPSTSGNEAHYREWALSCDGVGACRVDARWNGPGTVRVLLTGYHMEPVDSAVASGCAALIESVRPVGAEVTVASAQGLDVAVTARVTIDPSTTGDAVEKAFRAALEEYFEQAVKAAFESGGQSCTIYINRVAALLMGVPGVTDYADIKLNGGTGNITATALSVPVLGEVSIT